MGSLEFSRREFLKASLATLPFFCYGEAHAKSGLKEKGKKALVVKVTHPEMVKKRFPDPVITEKMLEVGLKKLTQKSTLEDAWKLFVKSNEKVVIKVNCLGGRFASSNKEIVDAIVKGIMSVGVSESNIVILDQFKGNMISARFNIQLKEGGIRVIPHPLMEYTDWVSFGNHKAKISKLFLWADVVINVPVFKDHDLAGITGAIKNIACGIVEKPQLLHRDIHNSIVNFYKLDDVYSKVKLIIADASWVLYNGGPKYNGEFIQKYNSIFISRDPVAIDRIQYEVIDLIRHEHKLKSLALSGRPPKFIEIADEKGIGCGDINNIKLEEIKLG